MKPSRCAALVLLRTRRRFIAFEGMAPGGACLPLTCFCYKNHPANTPFGYSPISLSSATLFKEPSCGTPSSSECHSEGGRMKDDSLPDSFQRAARSALVGLVGRIGGDPRGERGNGSYWRGGRSGRAVRPDQQSARPPFDVNLCLPARGGFTIQRGSKGGKPLM